MFVGKTRFGVLQLDKLEDGILTGVDSPIFEPKDFRINIKNEFKL